MGMGLLEGQKMSSSKGHVVLPGEAIDEYGADTVRFFLLNAAEPWQDYDWRADLVGDVRDQLDRFWRRAVEVIDAADGDAADGDPPARGLADPTAGIDPEADDLRHVDRWLLSRLQRVVGDVTEALEGAETRAASQAAFYDFEEDLRWYRRRTGGDRPGARRVRRVALETRLRLLAPFVPFLANELHERLTGTPAEDAPWPTANEALVDRRTELEEAQIERLVDDVNDIVDVTDTDPETIRVYVAADWKRRVYEAVVDVGTDAGAVISEVMADPEMRERGNEVSDLANELVEAVRTRGEDVAADLLDVDERATYEAAADFLGREFDADVEVYAEDGDPHDPAGRAGNAVPFRPAIHIE
jgi:leucyl-tRNA synthetase